MTIVPFLPAASFTTILVSGWGLREDAGSNALSDVKKEVGLRFVERNVTIHIQDLCTLFVLWHRAHFSIIQSYVFLDLAVHLKAAMAQMCFENGKYPCFSILHACRFHQLLKFWIVITYLIYNKWQIHDRNKISRKRTSCKFPFTCILRINSYSKRYWSVDRFS